MSLSHLSFLSVEGYMTFGGKLMGSLKETRRGGVSWKENYIVKKSKAKRLFNSPFLFLTSCFTSDVLCRENARAACAELMIC